VILQDLCECYDIVAAGDATMAPPNYSPVLCRFVILLSKKGEIVEVYDLEEEDKKRGITMIVPMQEVRSSGIKPYCICDKVKYFFGREWDKKKNAFISTDKHFEASRNLHEKLFGGVQDEYAHALLSFFTSVAEGAEGFQLPDDHLIYRDGENIVFRLEGGRYLHEQESMKHAWEQSLADDTKGNMAQCLLSGRINEVERVHRNKIKGVKGAQLAGASIISFNKASFLSYGKEQSYNAPISSQLVFKYTTALNYLLSSHGNRFILGDTTVVFWSNTERFKAEIIHNFFFGSGKQNTDEESSDKKQDTFRESQLLSILKALRNGYAKSDATFDLDLGSDSQVYILGLAPNKARIAIRFWYKDTVEHFLTALSDHYYDMQIIGKEGTRDLITINDILREISPKGKDGKRNAPSSFERSIFDAILHKTPYPYSMYMGVIMRIRAEVGDDYGINQRRTGIIKGYLNRFYKYQKHEKEITVTLNEDSKDISYSLGRLFAVLERIQYFANKSSTIRQRYFTSASTTPAVVFPTLLKLSVHHMEKLDNSTFFDKLIGNLLSLVDEFPVTLSLEEQGAFILGYYHQRQALFEKKEEDSNGN